MSEAARRAEAVQTASRGELSTSQLTAPCTIVKADAACITWPRVIEPSDHFGAHRMIGSTGAMKPDVLETMVVFMYWWQIERHDPQDFAERAVDASALLLFALISAMLSPFSRRRVSFYNATPPRSGFLSSETLTNRRPIRRHRAAGDQRVQHRGDHQKAGNI